MEERAEFLIGYSEASLISVDVGHCRLLVWEPRGLAGATEVAI
jgi:hypothetical protein